MQFTPHDQLCIYTDFSISTCSASEMGGLHISSRGRHGVEVAQSTGEHMDAVGRNQAEILKVPCVLSEPKGGLDFCSDQQNINSSGFISFTNVLPVDL